MKTATLFRLAVLAIILLFNIPGIKAQNPTSPAIDTVQMTPAATPVAPTAAPAPAAPAPAPAAPAPKPEKEKKDGFNSHTRFGVRAGGIISKQDYESNTLPEDVDSKVGIDLAVLASIPIGGGFFNLQPEVHWMQKGFKLNDVDIYGDVTSTLNYLEIPLLARVNFGGSLKVYAFAGPAIGFLLSGTYEDDTRTLDPTDYLDDTEYTGYIGLGVGLGTLEVDLRYIAGLSDISSGEEFRNAKNSSFGAGLSLKF